MRRKERAKSEIASFRPPAQSCTRIGQTMDPASADGSAFKRRRTSSSSSRPAQQNRSPSAPDQIISTAKAKGKGKLAGFDDEEEEEENLLVKGEVGADREEDPEAPDQGCAICLAPVVNRVRCVQALTNRDALF